MSDRPLQKTTSTFIISTLEKPQHGSYLPTEHLTRTAVKVYPVMEHELQTISAHNWQATAFYSAASTFTGFAIGLVINVFVAEKLSDLARHTWFIFEGLFAAAALVCYLIGRASSRQRYADIEKIKRECGVEQIIDRRPYWMRLIRSDRQSP
jgi:hypothetical protein